MYHLCDGLQDCDDYGQFGGGCGPEVVLFGLSEGKWHRLDNIGSIMYFVTVLVYFTDWPTEDMVNINRFTMLWIIVVLQELDPWDLKNTLVPILLQVAVLAIKRIHDLWVLEAPFRLVLYHAKRAALYQGIAIVFFVMALDEHGDPYRMCHGLWHTFCAIAASHHWKLVEPRTKLLGGWHSQGNKKKQVV